MLKLFTKAPTYLIIALLCSVAPSALSQITVAPQEYCGPNTVDFTATGSQCADYLWYNSANGGSPIGSGCNFTSPITSYNEKYFVATPHMTTTEPACATIEWYDSENSNTPVGTGCTYSEPSNDIKSVYYVKQPGATLTTTEGYDWGDLGSSTHFWTTNNNAEKYAAYFDAKVGFTLNSIDVRLSRISWNPCGGATGTYFTIQLTDQNGTVMFSSTPQLPCGSGDQTVTVPLGWYVPADVNYRLRLVNVNINQYVYVNTGGADYSVNGPLDSQYLHIKAYGNTQGGQQNYYGGLYNWNITVDPRVPVLNPRTLASAIDTCNLTCGDSIDLNTWTQRGPATAGTWTVAPDGKSVFQSINAPQPTFFVSPEDFINVELTGSFQTSDNDNDWMGFVVGFTDPITNPTQQSYMLFDWAMDTQYGSHFTFVNKVKDLSTVSHSTNASDYWSHVPDPGFVPFYSNTGAGSGWQRNVKYDFTLSYTSTRVVITMDGGTFNNDTIVDVLGCFQPGKFGFYNFSQANVTYSDFSYKLQTDYVISDNSICLGESVNLTAYQNNICTNSSTNIANWQWDFSTGESFSDTNLTNVIPSSSGVVDVTLTVTDSVKCKATMTKSITVADNYLPVLSTNQPAICSGNNTDLTATSYPGANYQWFEVGAGSVTSSTVNDSVHTISSAGVYYAEVESPNGCIGRSDSMSIAVDNLPNPSLSNSPPVCVGDTFTLSTAASINNFDWNITSGDSLEQNQNTHSIIATGGDITVEVNETTSLGCTNSDQTIVTVNAPIDTANYQIVCGVSDFTVVLDVTGGNPASYDVSGLPGSFVGNTWTSSVVADGSAFNLQVKDGNTCNEINISDQRQCSCVDSAQISGTHSICGDQGSFDLDVVFNQPGTFSFDIMRNGTLHSSQANEASPFTITVTDSGSYTLSNVTQTCIGTGQGTASVAFMPLSSSPVTKDTSVCQNSGSIMAQAVGTNILWYDTDTNSIPQPTVSGSIASTFDYLVTQNDNGCESEVGSISIEVKAEPQAPTAQNVSYCLTQPSDSLVATGSAISWYTDQALSNSVSNPVYPSTGTAGTETWFLTQTINGCTSASSSVSSTVHNLPTVSILGAADTVCPNSSQNMSFNHDQIQGFEWSISDPLITTSVNAIDSSLEFTAPTTGPFNIQLKLTDNNGCVDSIAKEQHIFTYNPLIINIPDSLCVGDTGYAITTYRDGIMNWSSPSSGVDILMNGNDSVQYQITSAGSYQIDLNEVVSGCSITSSATHSTAHQPSINFNLVAELCASDQDVVLTATPAGGVYSGNGVSNNLFSPSDILVIKDQTTAISYDYTSASGCTASAQGSTIVRSAAQVSLVGDSAFCGSVSNSPMTITSSKSGSFTFDLYSNGILVSSHLANSSPFTISVVDSGTYAIVNPTQKNCPGIAIGSAEVSINQIPAPIALSVNGPVCANDTFSVSATGIAMDPTWSITNFTDTTWSNGQMDIINSGDATSIEVSHVSAEGCENTTALDVDFSAQSPEPVVSDVSYCQDDLAIPLTAIGNNLFWYSLPVQGSVLAATPTPSTSSHGSTNYYVTQQKLGECRSEYASLLVAVKPTPVAPTPFSFDYCLNSIAQPFDFSPDTTSWFDSLGSPLANQPLPITNVETFQKYFVTRWENGCESPQSIVTSQTHALPAPLATSSRDTACPQEMISLSAMSNIGSQLTWSVAGTSISTEANFDYTAPNSGSAQLWLREQDVNGCIDSTSITIYTYNFPVQLISSQDTVCLNDTIAATVTDRGGSLTWALSSEGNLVAENNAELIFTNSSEADVTVTLGESIQGCELTSSKSVHFISPESITIQVPDSLCSNASLVDIEVQPTGGLLLGQGVSGQSFDASLAVSNENNEITYRYVSRHGCQSEMAENIYVRALPDLQILTTDVVMCLNESILLNSNVQDNRIQWEHEGYTIGFGNQLEANTPGEYRISLNDGICISESSTIDLHQQEVEVTTSKNLLLEPNEELTDVADVVIIGFQSDYSVSWSLAGQQVTDDERLSWETTEGSYVATATTIHGCSANDTLHVEILYPIEIPNTFTPNGDGINDRWNISNLEDYDYHELNVFNRWGNLIFTSYSETSWDGTFNGSPLPAGTYYYTLRLSEEYDPFKGHLTLMK